ncbi:MAG: hypothetical protein LC674_06270, partial [Actinobacteria bacterium]|nr:hypothetical protein [Actinomycetota bacterium]
VWERSSSLQWVLGKHRNREERGAMSPGVLRHAIDVQKKIRGRYEARGTGQSPRDTACLSAWLPNHATYGRRYLS